MFLFIFITHLLVSKLAPKQHSARD